MSDSGKSQKSNSAVDANLAQQNPTKGLNISRASRAAVPALGMQQFLHFGQGAVVDLDIRVRSTMWCHCVVVVY